MQSYLEKKNTYKQKSLKNSLGHIWEYSHIQGKNKEMAWQAYHEKEIQERRFSNFFQL